MKIPIAAVASSCLINLNFSKTTKKNKSRIEFYELNKLVNSHFVSKNCCHFHILSFHEKNGMFLRGVGEFEARQDKVLL